MPNGKEKTHLHGEIEKAQVPAGAGNDVLVHQGHADGGQAVGEYSSAGIISNSRGKARHRSRDVAIMLRPTLVDGKQFVLADAVSRTRHGACRGEGDEEGTESSAGRKVTAKWE